MKRLSWLLIIAYQRWAPSRLRGVCRFEPTCSCYALLAIERYGWQRGWYMAIRRIARCRPPHTGRDEP